MASRLPLLILIVSTIFLLIGICISLPYRRDTAIQLSNCNESVPHVVIINSTNGPILYCHKCTWNCQVGHGLLMPCNGQNITKSEFKRECVPCVAGVNFSTGDTLHCQPCLTKKCVDGEKMEGRCEANGDKRTCERCQLKNWYYNDTQKVCLPCDCQNVTAEIKHICSGLGVNLQCPVLTTNTSFPSNNEKRDGWKTIYTIIIVVCSLFSLVLYFCCVGRRAKKLKLNHPRLSVCSKEWFCPIFFFKGATRSRPPSYTAEDKHAQNGNVSLKQGDSQENIKLLLKTTECEQKKLKFFEMNSETCRKILQALKSNIDTGMGYPTLAGYMDFSAKKVKEFEEDGNPCKSMLECWSNLDNTANNVLKLKDLVVKLQRDDILELLKSELQQAKERCRCPKCHVVAVKVS